jgi:hypothetical protein
VDGPFGRQIRSASVAGHLAQRFVLVEASFVGRGVTGFRRGVVKELDGRGSPVCLMES